jgi:hypothetical protein
MAVSVVIDVRWRPKTSAEHFPTPGLRKKPREVALPRIAPSASLPEEFGATLRFEETV